MTTETQRKQRTENIWQAWLILFKGTVTETADKASAILVERVTDILVAGLVLAFTAVMTFFIYSLGNERMTAIAIIGVAFCWFAALDQLNTSRVATLGQMMFFSAFVPFVLIATGAGATPSAVLTLAMVHLQAIFWTAIALFASALLARLILKAAVRLVWSGTKRLRHDKSPDVDPFVEGIQEGADGL